MNMYTRHITVANVVIKVDDDCTCEGDPSPKLTQHAMELLSNSLAQLSSDTQTQGEAC